MANRLVTFEVSPVGSNRLYANGRQQCKLAIKILKVDDNNVVQTLTAQEIDSVTILPYSNQVFPAQARGWSCDKEKNLYDQGVPQGTREGAEIEGEAPPDPPGDPKDNRKPVIIDRFMRFDNSLAPAVAAKFMACMTLDAGTPRAKKITTYFDDGNHSFDEFVTLDPQVPHRLLLGDLKAEHDFEAYHVEYAKDKRVDVDVYYWTLPNKFRILSETFANMGFTGTKVRFAYARNEGTLYTGMAIVFSATSLTLGDIGNLPKSDKLNASSSVRLQKSGVTALRAARYFCSNMSTSPAYNKLLSWTIIDNFGCESRFVLRSNDSDKGNTLVLQDP